MASMPCPVKTRDSFRTSRQPLQFKLDDSSRYNTSKPLLIGRTVFAHTVAGT
jgi:hypothetical protein